MTNFISGGALFLYGCVYPQAMLAQEMPYAHLPERLTGYNS